jgi:hypothetical protein
VFRNCVQLQYPKTGCAALARILLVYWSRDNEIHQPNEVEECRHPKSSSSSMVTLSHHGKFGLSLSCLTVALPMSFSVTTPAKTKAKCTRKIRKSERNYQRCDTSCTVMKLSYNKVSGLSYTTHLSRFGHAPVGIRHLAEQPQPTAHRPQLCRHHV